MLDKLDKFKQMLVKWGIPSVGLSVAVHFIQQGQWIPAILALVGAFLLWALALGKRFFQRFSSRFSSKVEEKIDPLADKLADWMVSTLETSLIRLWWKLTFNFQGKYYQSLIYQYRNYRIQGLKTKPGVGLDLEKLFVSLRVAPESPDRISSAIIQAEKQKGKLSIWDFLVMPKEQSYRCIAIIAPPGAGKTTLLEHITLTYANNTQYRQHRQSPKLIPILVYLRSIRDDITKKNAPNLAELVKERLCQEDKELDSLHWFVDNLKSGRCLVMLDGLDEVADEQQRRDVSKWVDRQINRYPKARFIITSRPFGYHSAPLEGVQTVLEVQPFSLVEMSQFLHNWYLQTETKKRGGKVDRGVVQDAKRSADDLIARIKSSPAIASMALNPLLLTMIATVHDNRGALPGRRVELYAEICDVLLGRRQDAKGISNPLTAEQNKRVLQVLALCLMQAKSREFTLANASNWIREKLSAVAGDGLDPNQYLLKVTDLSGLLIEKERGKYEFAHKSFQEYLAAVQIRDTTQVQLLAKKMNEAWWDETIRLYAAQGDATDLIFAAIRNPSVNSLTLAYDCLTEGLEVQPEARQPLEKILEAGLESNDQQIAKLAAEVKLSRRLKNLLRIDENTEIDMSYITCAEYQLFIDTRRKEGQVRHPDHWENFHFERGQATEPVKGVRASYAKEFCEWLTERFPNNENKVGILFRLPSYVEMESYPISLTEIGCWCTGVKGTTIEGIEATQWETWKKLFDLDLDHARNHILDSDPALALDLDLDHARNLDHALALDLDLDLARDLARDRDLALDLDLDSDLALALDSDLALALALALAVDLDSALDLNLARALDLARDLDFAHARARERARIGTRDLVFDLDLIRTYLLILLTFWYLLLIAYQRIASKQKFLKTFNLSREECQKRRDKCQKNYERVTAIYGFLLLTEKRRKGEMPAWEGIRIVLLSREQ